MRESTDPDRIGMANGRVADVHVLCHWEQDFDLARGRKAEALTTLLEYQQNARRSPSPDVASLLNLRKSGYDASSLR